MAVYLEGLHQLHWRCLHWKVTMLIVSKCAFLSHLPCEGLVREFTLHWLGEAFPDRHIMLVGFDFYRQAPHLWQ